MDSLPLLQVFKREKTDVQVPNPKEEKAVFPFTWLVFKPQEGAVEKFECNKNTRTDATRYTG